MPANDLRVGNRAAYFRKAIKSPDFESERVLTRDAFQFIDLWLQQHCKEAMGYWKQARAYYLASKALPPTSAPLTIYYCFLNAAKALLLVKGIEAAEFHGVAGDFDPNSKRVLSNEIVTIQRRGVLHALSTYLEEEETEQIHSLSDLLANLPFIHRAYRYTYSSQNELFIPLRNVLYRNYEGHVCVTAQITGRFADNRSLRSLPSAYERDLGYEDKCIIRTRQRIRWHSHNSSRAEKERARARLLTYHRKRRKDLVFISAPESLWYIKRNGTGAKRIDRYGMTVIMAAMHRLSELSRYDPNGLTRYLEGRANWLLSEFIELAPAQFIDELACEMTSLELGLPGVRPG